MCSRTKLCVVSLGMSRSSYMCRMLLVAVQSFSANDVFEGLGGKMLSDSWCVFKMSVGIQ